MITSSQIAPGMVLTVDKKVYRVESSVKVTVTKGNPFVKAKLRDLVTDEVIEKNFKVGQKVDDVTLDERQLEFLYPEGKDFLFIDIDNLEQVLVPSSIVEDKINFLKEGTAVKAVFYGSTVFSIELPQFLELMVVKTDETEDTLKMTSSTKTLILETGAKLEGPLFVESGDIIKVDPRVGEYIQRV